MHNSFILGHTKLNISLKTSEYSFLVIWWIKWLYNRFGSAFSFQRGFQKSNSPLTWTPMDRYFKSHPQCKGFKNLKKCCKSLLNLWLDGNFKNYNWQPGRTCSRRHFALLMSRLTLLGSEEGLGRSNLELHHDVINNNFKIIIIT